MLGRWLESWHPLLKMPWGVDHPLLLHVQWVLCSSGGPCRAEELERALGGAEVGLGLVFTSPVPALGWLARSAPFLGGHHTGLAGASVQDMLGVPCVCLGARLEALGGWPQSWGPSCCPEVPCGLTFPSSCPHAPCRVGPDQPWTLAAHFPELDIFRAQICRHPQDRACLSLVPLFCPFLASPGTAGTLPLWCLYLSLHLSLHLGCSDCWGKGSCIPVCGSSEASCFLLCGRAWGRAAGRYFGQGLDLRWFTPMLP